MLRISKLTDYGTVVLAHLAANQATVCSAADVAEATGVAPPTVSKLLKALARADLVTSTRGANGGYRLARPPQDISAADVIDALDGPVSISRALCDVTLNDLIRANSPLPTFRFAGLPISVEKTVNQHGN